MCKHSREHVMLWMQNLSHLRWELQVFPDLLPGCHKQGNHNVTLAGMHLFSLVCSSSFYASTFFSSIKPRCSPTSQNTNGLNSIFIQSFYLLKGLKMLFLSSSVITNQSSCNASDLRQMWDVMIRSLHDSHRSNISLFFSRSSEFINVSSSACNTGSLQLMQTYQILFPPKASCGRTWLLHHYTPYNVHPRSWISIHRPTKKWISTTVSNKNIHTVYLGMHEWM